MNKLQGKLQRFNPRGFVFIVRDDNQPNLFCHANQLEDAGIDADTGVLGLRVEFEVGTSLDGRTYATAIEKLSD